MEPQTLPILDALLLAAMTVAGIVVVSDRHRTLVAKANNEDDSQRGRQRRKLHLATFWTLTATLLATL